MRVLYSYVALVFYTHCSPPYGTKVNARTQDKKNEDHGIIGLLCGRISKEY